MHASASRPFVASFQPVYPPLVADVHQQLPGKHGRTVAWVLVHASFFTTVLFYAAVALLGEFMLDLEVPGVPSPHFSAEICALLSVAW